MKKLITSKKNIFLALSFLFLFLLLAWYLLLSSSFRNIANFSQEELEYAEDFLLDKKSEDYSSVSVSAPWKDKLKKDKKSSFSIEDQLEKEFQKEYEQELLKDLEDKTGQKRKKTNLEENLENQHYQFLNAGYEVLTKERAESLVKNAREDGYEVTLDENYQVISVRRIPLK